MTFLFHQNLSLLFLMIRTNEIQIHLLFQSAKITRLFFPDIQVSWKLKKLVIPNIINRIPTKSWPKSKKLTLMNLKTTKSTLASQVRCLLKSSPIKNPANIVGNVSNRNCWETRVKRTFTKLLKRLKPKYAQQGVCSHLVLAIVDGDALKDSLKNKDKLFSMHSGVLVILNSNGYSSQEIWSKWNPPRLDIHILKEASTLRITLGSKVVRKKGFVKHSSLIRWTFQRRWSERLKRKCKTPSLPSKISGEASLRPIEFYKNKRIKKCYAR